MTGLRGPNAMTGLRGPNAVTGLRGPNAVTSPAVEPICRCRNLSVDLESGEGPRRILQGITADLRPGEFVSIMGRSGTGKTTLLRVLSGLIEPAPGSDLTFAGRPVVGPPEGAVFVFQNYAASLLPWRTVERNVALGLEGRVSKSELRERVTEALATVGLSGRAKDYPWRLSGGMQQRVQLARALAMDARLLLMDEPFGALDAITKATLQDELQRVHQERRPAVAFVTHDIDEAVYLSDRIVILAGLRGPNAEAGLRGPNAGDAGPATIALELSVDLPRPRHQLATKALPEFHDLRRRVYDEIVRDDG